jgi:hypothetical protein
MAGGYHPPHRAPPRPERVRRIEPGFAFIPNRFLHAGFLASLSHAERSLYVFFVLAGDRNGVSFYSYDRICSTLEITPDDYVVVRNSLIDKDLIAFDGTRFQVLSLPQAPVIAPARPLVTSEDFEQHDPATIAHVIRSSLSRRR